MLYKQGHGCFPDRIHVLMRPFLDELQVFSFFKGGQAFLRLLVGSPSKLGEMIDGREPQLERVLQEREVTLLKLETARCRHGVVMVFG